jgi:hypothetical protein
MFTAATALLHQVSPGEPAIAAQDRYRRRPIGTSSLLAPQSRNAMRLAMSSSRQRAFISEPHGAATAFALQLDAGALKMRTSVVRRLDAVMPARSVSLGKTRSNGSSPTNPTTPGVSAASKLERPPAEKPTSMMRWLLAPKVSVLRSRLTKPAIALALHRKSKVQGISGVIARTPLAASAWACSPHGGATTCKAMGQNGCPFLWAYGFIDIHFYGSAVDFDYLRLRNYFCCGLSRMTCAECRQKNKSDGLQEFRGGHIGRYSTYPTTDWLNLFDGLKSTNPTFCITLFSPTHCTTLWRRLHCHQKLGTVQLHLLLFPGIRCKKRNIGPS